MSVAVGGLIAGYEDHVVLDGISFRVASGGWLAAIGPNGAGKTTLIKAIAGLHPAQGTIELDGRSIGSRSRRELARLVAYVPQRPEMPPTMTVAEYVFLGRTPHLSYLGVERAVDRAVVGAVLDRMDLRELCDRPLGAISGGEAQRASLGRALAQQSPILLLDEPTASLDIGHQQQVLELVDELRRERSLTVVAAMHDLTLAGQYASELMLISNGRVVAAGAPNEVLTESILTSCYGASLRILLSEDGSVTVVPTRATAAARATD